jgi:hypothetical protein
VSFRSTLRNLITGLTIPQEYCCLDGAVLSSPFSISASVPQGEGAVDVTVSHLFLGYKPLLVGLTNTSLGSITANHGRVNLNFHLRPGDAHRSVKGFPANATSLARLALKKIDERSVGNEVVGIYEGEFGTHRFLTDFHQRMNRLRAWLRKSAPGNVSLPGNLADQVRIAYSVPRTISVITLLDATRMNMFPTDLHGPVGDRHYAGSLRIAGKANQQVERGQRIVLSDVPARLYREVYALGKNHMLEPRDEKEFNLSAMRSRTFGFPLPAGVLRYRELKKIDHLDAGLHRIHFYEQVDSEGTLPGSWLAHIHQYYAQWRVNHGLDTALLLRSS